MKAKNCLAGIAAACLLAGNCYSADYPQRPVKIVVPWPAGGLVDLPARLIGQSLSKAYGQPFIIENKPGAGGIIGEQAVAKATPDGYTLMVTTSALNMNAAIRSGKPGAKRKEFEPVAAISYVPSVLVVNPARGPRSVQELIRWARARPGKMNYASAGIGTPAHFAAELFKSMEKLDILHVPYKGGPAAMMGQIEGQVDFQFANLTVALPQISGGKVRALAVTSARRSSLLPEVPTMAQAGVPGFEADQWIGVLAPAGTPQAIVHSLNAQVINMLADPQARRALVDSGMVPAAAESAAAFGAYLKQDLVRWTRVARTAHIQAQ